MIEFLPTVNACLNASAATLLIIGFICIRRGRVRAHAVCMLAALADSALFLACYLVYHAQAGSKPFPGSGHWRSIYFAILVPHILLAAGMLPLIFITLTRALKGELSRHRRIARWTLPIWLYVSITGVIVYVMLYQVRW